MTPEERAKKLVGDMPWVTEHLTPDQLRDLPKQVGTSMRVSFEEGFQAGLEAAAKLAELTAEQHHSDRACVALIDLAAVIRQMKPKEEQ